MDMDLAKERYKEACLGWDDVYLAAKDDLRFTYDIDSGQWDKDVRQKRESAGRPCLTINKTLKFVRQMRGEFSMNRPRMDVIPADDTADVYMAKLYNGIIRQIEYLSNAALAYDTAYQHAISCSVGYFRIITDYENEKSFNQIIKIKRVLNPISIHFDPYAEEFNLEDARYCFVEELIDEKTFKKRYPKAEALNFDGEKENLLGSWIQEDKVRVCEYFYKEPVKKTIVLLDNGGIIELTKNMTPELIRRKGFKIVNDRVVDSHVVKWAKICGLNEPLEEKEWIGSQIPIIPMFGDEIVVDGRRYYLSMIRGAKGPQRMYNYWASAATENVMQTPKTPFILDHRQIKGLEAEWNDANINPRPYLRYHAIGGLPKPTREPQTQVPAAIIQMMQSTAYDIEDHLGRYEAAKGEASNERSGKAIIARINQSDKGTFTFVDNATRAIIAGLKQIVEIIPKVYDTKRALTILGEDGSRQRVNVNVPVIGPNGELSTSNDLTVGTYDVIASVGPSFSSRREEMSKMLIESLQYAPMLAPILTPLIFKYSDWPGSQEVYNEIMSGIQQAQAQQAVNEQVEGQAAERMGYNQVRIQS